MSQLVVLLILLISSFGTAQVLVINELDPDTPSTDTAEFIELKSDSPNFSTNGYILVFFNGSTNGGNSSYLVIDLEGYTTDNNGLLVVGSSNVFPAPQYLIAQNLIQNGADAVGIYEASVNDFPEGTLATQSNLIDAMVYDTNDSDDATLLALMGETNQYNDNGTNANPKSIQRFVDVNGVETYSAVEPTPRRENDGSGSLVNPIAITVAESQVEEGSTFDITFTAENAMTLDLNFSISLNNFGFNTTDFTGATSLTIATGQTTTSTTITLIDDIDNEGDEVLKIRFLDLIEPEIPFNNSVEVRVVDNDFTAAAWGTPLNSTFNMVGSTQPVGYYDSLNGLANLELRQALQDIIADPSIVRAQTYADVIDILIEADQNPENSNQVWLVYSEEGRAKLDIQTGSNNTNKWNREHTFPRSRGGFGDIEEDEIADGIDVFWETKSDSLRHGNSDAHALRAADASENSSRSNKHYGDYVGPVGNLQSFRGDVARSVFYMAIRYNGLQLVNGFPLLLDPPAGDFGDLATLLDWHRNDPPDDFEMNRNNIIYNWQFNRNPFIDQPDLVEFIWGNSTGLAWGQGLSTEENALLQAVIYPNPTKGRVYITGFNTAIEVEVFSIDGKRLICFETVEDYIDLDLASGLYLLKLTSANSSIVKKVMVD